MDAAAESVALSPPPSPALALSVPDLPSSTEFRKERPKAPTRALSVNNRVENAPKMFPSNVIRTSKYTLLTFLPINLFEQFRRIANFYFLVIICMSIPAELAPYPWYTTAMPLVFILAISGVKDGYEDFLRHREDRAANSRMFQAVASDGSLFSIRSGDITVGDVIRIEEGQEFPADLILLLTSKHDNSCYVNTANLDGEVTPKLRIGPQLADQYNAVLDLSLLNGAKVEFGDPCKQLDGFEGTLTLTNGTQKPIGDRQVLLRGAKLRGTAHVYAVVFATGPETKLMLNRNPIRYKFSTFERVLNRCVLASLAIELALCIIMAVLNHFQRVATLSGSDMVMLDVERNQDAFPGLKLFITSFILYSFLIPVSLFVTIDFVKIGQAMVIEMDNEMSIAASEADRAEGVHRLYSTVKSSNLNDELGQVEYLFTDKTGTLTCNRMELSNVSADGFISQNKRLETASTIASDQTRASLVPRESSKTVQTLQNLVQWAFKHVIDGRSVDDLEPVDTERRAQHARNSLASPDVLTAFSAASLSKSEKNVQDMLFCMLVCNDVQPEKAGDRVEFVSASPDEIALVGALSRNGLRLVSAGPSQPWVIRLDVVPEHSFTFGRVAQLDFSSDRRRMSVVVRAPDGTVVLFTKGASSTIEPFLSTDPANAMILAETQKHLTQFAKRGSRTLMMASKMLEEQQVIDFLVAYEKASVLLEGREKGIEKAFAMIEKNLRLLGATSVEDQLQELVPETIEQLLKAGVTIMMLTGDMQETAVTIGRKSRIISKESKLIFIQAETAKQCEYLLDRYIAKADESMGKDDLVGKKRKLAMVLNGNSLEMAIQHCPDKFLQLFARCETIICNRATPSQKAFVVALVTSRFSAITMAIGDGANDVSMIRKAHVGVGLIGREGRQAAQSADFVLHRFNHLRRLLFVHGRYSYQRSARVVLFSFFKNFLYPLPLFWFSCFSQFSGQSIYDSLIITNFNMFFSSLPPLIAGVLEKDVVESALLKHPIAYKKFREHPTFSLSIFMSWMALGMYQSLVIYFLGHAFFYPSEGVLASQNGIVLDMWTFGTWIGTVAIVNVNLSFLCRTTNLTVATIICSLAGIFFYLVFLAGYCSWFPKIAPNMYGMNPYVFATPTAYLYYFIALLVCLMPIVVSNLIAREYYPTYATVLREHCSDRQSPASQGEIDCCMTDHVENAAAIDPLAESSSDDDERRPEKKVSLQRSRSLSEGAPPPQARPQLQIKIDMPDSSQHIQIQG